MKQASITLYKKELYTDIDAKTFKRTDASLVQHPERTQNAVASDTKEELDELLLMRYCDLWDARLRRRLKFCIVDDGNVLTYTDAPEDNDRYTYNLQLDDLLTSSDVRAIGTLMHNFIVRGALHDWYLHCGVDITGVESLDALQDLEDEITSGLRGRSYGRKPMQPFGPAHWNYEREEF